MKNLRYIIRDREAGNVIDSFATSDEAKSELVRFEKIDKKEGSFTPDFYEVWDSYLEEEITETIKEKLGKQIEKLRKECGVSTYELEQKGIHPSLPSTIEKGQKGYSMDSLIKYLNAIDEDIFLSVEKKEKKKT